MNNIRICKLDFCKNKHFGKGLCSSHYHKYMRYGICVYPDRICKTDNCNNEFKPTKNDQVFCSVKCGARFINRTEKSKKYKENYEKTSPVFKAKKIRISAKWRANNRLKIRAHSLARKLPVKMCEVVNCGKIGEKHHDNYSKPLDVRYLCKKHHDKVTWKHIV